MFADRTHTEPVKASLLLTTLVGEVLEVNSVLDRNLFVRERLSIVEWS